MTSAPNESDGFGFMLFNFVWYPDVDPLGAETLGMLSAIIWYKYLRNNSVRFAGLVS